MTDKKEQFKECIELMQRDVAEFEAKYQGDLRKGRMSASGTARQGALTSISTSSEHNR